MDWFLFDRDLRHERVTGQVTEAYLGPCKTFTMKIFEQQLIIFTKISTIDVLQSHKYASRLANLHFIKIARVRSFSGPYSVRMRENKDQKTPNTDTFYAVLRREKRFDESLSQMGERAYSMKDLLFRRGCSFEVRHSFEETHYLQRRFQNVKTNIIQNKKIYHKNERECSLKNRK